MPHRHAHKIVYGSLFSVETVFPDDGSMRLDDETNNKTKIPKSLCSSKGHLTLGTEGFVNNSQLLGAPFPSGVFLGVGTLMGVFLCGKKSIVLKTWCP